MLALFCVVCRRVRACVRACVRASAQGWHRSEAQPHPRLDRCRDARERWPHCAQLCCTDACAKPLCGHETCAWKVPAGADPLDGRDERHDVQLRECSGRALQRTPGRPGGAALTGRALRHASAARVPAQMWRGEPSPGADVAAPSRVPAQMWQGEPSPDADVAGRRYWRGRAQSGCRCGRGRAWMLCAAGAAATMR
jgi:hypothetical protein